MSLVESLSSVLLRFLPREYFLKIRSVYFSLKTKVSPLLRMMHGTFTTQDLIAELDANLDSDWRVLMLHTSVNNLAPMYEGSALELLQELIKYTGEERTLVMPAFNFGDDGEGARERLKREPRFDLRRTPSQMGLMTELFRRSRGVLQSRHPVYRIAALGPEAEAIVAGHELAPSGMGEDTPFGYMARCNAHIFGIGKSFQVMTQVHQVETLMADQWPSPLGEMPNLKVTVVEKDTETEMEIGGAHQQWRFNIWKLRELMSPEQLREWRFHNCPMFAARAGEVTDTLVEAAKRGTILYDP